MGQFRGMILILAILALHGGCCHSRTEAEELERARAEDYKDKWVQEVRFHYQTQMIKSQELKELSDMLEALRAENEELRKQVREKKNAEGK